MSENVALLRAILDDPDDDLPRLAFADWLEERGDDQQLARADFIRTQIALTRMADDDPARTALVLREATLLNAHGDRWRQVVEGLAGTPVFRRGFLDEVTLALPAFLKRGGELLDLVPVTMVHFEGNGKRLLDLAGHPILSRVRGLDLCSPGTHAGRVKEFLRSPGLGGMRRLWLRSRPLGGADGGWLGQAASMPALEELRVESASLFDEGVRYLVATPFFSNLRRVSLLNNGLTGVGVETLLAQPPPGLTHLDLRHNRPGCDLLAQSPVTSRLKELCLGGDRDRFVAIELDRLVSSPNVAGLTSFRVTGARDSPLGELLAESPRLAGLRHLDLRDSDLGNDGLTRLVQSRHLRRLTRLNLAHTSIGPDGVAALAGSANLAGLVSLSLRGNDLGNRGVAALAQSPHLRRLSELDLGGTRIRTEGFRALATSAILDTVVRLHLDGIATWQRDTELLARSPRFGPHTTLVLDGQAQGAELLRTTFPGRIEYR